MSLLFGISNTILCDRRTQYHTSPISVKWLSSCYLWKSHRPTVISNMKPGRRVKVSFGHHLVSDWHLRFYLCFINVNYKCTFLNHRNIPNNQPAYHSLIIIPWILQQVKLQGNFWTFFINVSFLNFKYNEHNIYIFSIIQFNNWLQALGEEPEKRQKWSNDCANISYSCFTVSVYLCSYTLYVVRPL